MGVGGVASELAELEDWLFFLLWRTLASSKQWLQVRDGPARGLKLAF
jgi:hypothetical protein